MTEDGESDLNPGTARAGGDIRNDVDNDDDDDGDNERRRKGKEKNNKHIARLGIRTFYVLTF